MKPVIVALLLGLACMAAAAAVAAERAVTLDSLLDEMVDRDAAARFPEPAYTCRQASSYDRASVSPEKPETWWANADTSFFIRSEQNGGREEWVMMDAEGPGCIVRWWITSSDPIGNLRIYFDGQKEPAVTMQAKELIGGAGLVGPPLSHLLDRGYNLYLPIPYAKHCKVTYDRPNFHVTHKGDDMLYYQINYRTYAPGTRVEPFSPQALKEAKDKIAGVQKTLLHPGALRATNLRTVEREPQTLAPGKSLQLKAAGPGAIRSLALKLKAADMAAATRSTVISIAMDGEPAVWCPAGDFFGSGVGVNPFRGWWRTVDKDGWMTCYWVMPFRQSSVVEVHNLGSQEVEVRLKTEQGDWTWDARSMHFHCNWRQQYPINTAKKHDWNYVTIQGKGIYMGDTLALVNPSPAWWGEGDEKVYVDGEKFPSHFGTGTEDYYGYAWGTPAFFESPFHAQPRADGPGSQGHVTNTRVRLLDGIPFTRSLRFDMEIWHWRPVNVAYASTTYWYGLPGAKGNHGPAPEMAKVFVPEMPKPPKVEGAIEGENLKILEKTGGVTEIQEIPNLNWSGWKQVWWRDAKPGQRIVFELPVDKAGTYKLTANLTLAVDYGIVQLSLDGRPLGGPIDLFHGGVTNRAYALGTHELAAGGHKLAVEITGANPKAVPRHMFGIDYLKLEPAK